MLIKINAEALAKAHGKKPGDTVTVEDRNGVPVDRYWRNRLNDALIDSSVTVIEEAKAPSGTVPEPPRNTKTEKKESK